MAATARKVAVLGATGWVGRHLCDVFARHGYGVLAVARTFAPHVCRHEFRRLDLAIADPETIADMLRASAVNVVINATDAANATDGWSRTEEEFVHFNVRVVKRLLTAMAMLPSDPRLVHLGTIHEYGPVAGGVLIHESLQPNPVGPYARSRLAGSEAVLNAARAGMVSGVVLRLVNVCGPHPSPATFPGKLLEQLRSAAGGGEVALSIADARRDFVDVRDAAEACFRAAETPVSGRVINIGSGVAFSLRDLVTLALTTARLPATVLKARDGPVTGSGTDWVRADIRLAEELLAWRPRINLPQSLQDMWEATGDPRHAATSGERKLTTTQRGDRE
ncbi:MAG: NAD-dependent epimerase/dehydratase family protein [Pseudonocardiaceae bacterium]